MLSEIVPTVDKKASKHASKKVVKILKKDFDPWETDIDWANTLGNICSEKVRRNPCKCITFDFTSFWKQV